MPTAGVPSTGQPPPELCSVSPGPQQGVPGLGTHGPAAATLCLGALGQLGGAAPVLAQQGLHAVDDVPDAVDEAVLLRLEDELVVDLEGAARGVLGAHRSRRPVPSPPPLPSPILTMTAAISSGLSPSRSNLNVTILLL